ncbi:hypothetical protein BDQ17DRAFT_1435443 [Cyathus striatus]|nr:hypothetical protein BDQ17DRAFT_1435443 [Cyathus striatus]
MLYIDIPYLGIYNHHSLCFIGHTNEEAQSSMDRYNELHSSRDYNVIDLTLAERCRFKLKIYNRDAVETRRITYICVIDACYIETESKASHDPKPVGGIYRMINPINKKPILVLVEEQQNTTENMQSPPIQQPTSTSGTSTDTVVDYQSTSASDSTNNATALENCK